MKARFLLGAVAATLLASPAAALDVERFESVVEKTLTAIESGDVDVNELLQYQDQLIEIGVEGAKGYGKEKPEFAAAMDFVAASAETIKAENLVSIEGAWHDGGALEAAGIDTEALYDDDYASIYLEAVIHPATAHIAARAYELTGDEDYLDVVEFELEEIVGHFEELKD
ncbi:MAG: hypothetical protein ACR2QF_14400 [Geminicoccaceae bacterium]